MKFDVLDLKKGLSNGIDRASFYLEKKLSVEDSSNLNTKLAIVFNAYPSELNARFITFFTELVTIAETSRLNYQEPFLEKEELKSFLEHSAAFFNSFTHP